MVVPTVLPILSNETERGLYKNHCYCSIVCVFSSSEYANNECTSEANRDAHPPMRGRLLLKSTPEHSLAGAP